MVARGAPNALAAAAYWLPVPTSRDRILLGTGNAEVAELEDALRSGRSGPCAREGSSPSFGTS